jgi:integrase
MADTETVARAAAAWLGEAQGRLAGSSFDTYRQTLVRHVAPSAVGAMPLGEAKPSAVNELLQSVAQTSGPGAAKLVRSVLNGTFERAVARDVVHVNPVRQARPVRMPRKLRPAEGERDTRRALTREERDRLIEYVDADPYCEKYDLADLIAFMEGTGVRDGEALALQWKNLDLNGERPTATIAATISRVAGQGNEVQTSTKTGQDRVVFLPLWLAERLGHVVSEQGGRPGERSTTGRVSSSTSPPLGTPRPRCGPAATCGTGATPPSSSDTSTTRLDSLG